MRRSMRGLNWVIPGNRLEHCWHVASTWAACRMVIEKRLEDIMETYRETKERQQRHIDKEKQSEAVTKQYQSGGVQPSEK